MDMTEYLEIDVNGLAIGGIYNAYDGSPPSDWIPITGDASLGWSWDGTSWSAPTVSVDELRAERNRLLKEGDHIWGRHQEQLAIGQTTGVFNLTHTDTELHEILVYRQELRDLPSGYVPVVRPAYPIKL